MTFSLARYEPQFRSSLFLIILYSIPAWLTLRPSGVDDPDVWWHLRTGQWILEHRWVPYNDWFSTFGMGKPWVAYSWLFELLIYGLFSRLGLIGLLIYVYALMLAITAALHSLVRKFEPRLVYSVPLTVLGVLCLAPYRIPRPWLFTILFFILELDILVSVRRSRSYRRLLLLPLLFALWANIHIQFVYGLFVLGVAALEDPLNRLLGHNTAAGEVQDRPIPFGTMVLVTTACALAVLVNPYHVRMYAIVWEFVRMPGLYGLISELQAMQFRSLPDWLVLLLTLWAAFALGRRRRISPFWGLLFLTGAFLSFRSSRDSWFVVVVALTIIPNARATSIIATPPKISKAQVVIVVMAVGILVLSAARAAQLSENSLQNTIAGVYPVVAANVVEERRYRGPLYNHFDWGGYLIWRLRGLPVTIDGRSNLHDATRVKHSAEVWNGTPHWASDPELAAARVVIAEKDFPLTQLLRLDSRFETVYEDEVAVVFIARTGSAKQ
jgi:hypothetical protein